MGKFEEVTLKSLKTSLGELLNDNSSKDEDKKTVISILKNAGKARDKYLKAIIEYKVNGEEKSAARNIKFLKNNRYCEYIAGEDIVNSTIYHLLKRLETRKIFTEPEIRQCTTTRYLHRDETSFVKDICDSNGVLPWDDYKKQQEYVIGLLNQVCSYRQVKDDVGCMIYGGESIVVHVSSFIDFVNASFDKDSNKHAEILAGLARTTYSLLKHVSDDYRSINSSVFLQKLFSSNIFNQDIKKLPKEAKQILIEVAKKYSPALDTDKIFEPNKDLAASPTNTPRSTNSTSVSNISVSNSK